MPNIWTHIIFAESICQDIGRSDITETSNQALYMGAQGPDPFFYHNFWPFLPDRNVAEVGMKLHTEQCGPFLMDMIERGAFLKNQMQAFILGFVSHHILDRHTHPYIHYHAGYEENKHQKLEVIIDTLLLERNKGLKSWKNPVHKEIRIGKLKKSIAELMQSLILTHFSQTAATYPSQFIERSYSDIQRAQRVLYDPWHWKNKWLSSLVSSFSHQPITRQKDFLNEDRLEWNHPATNEKQTESFLDLYEEALKEGKGLFRLILHYWTEPTEEKLDEIESIIGNISYDTGKPLLENHQNKWSQPIV